MMYAETGGGWRTRMEKTKKGELLHLPRLAAEPTAEEDDEEEEAGAGDCAAAAAAAAGAAEAVRSEEEEDGWRRSPLRWW